MGWIEALGFTTPQTPFTRERRPALPRPFPPRDPDTAPDLHDLAAAERKGHVRNLEKPFPDKPRPTQLRNT